MERIRLDEHTLEIQLAKQLLEHSALMVFASGVAGLGDRHAQGRGVQRYLGDERGTTTTGGLDRTAQGLAIADQLIEIDCPAWNLGDGPVSDRGADSSHVHLQKEVAKGGVRRRTLELKSQGLGEYGVMAPGEALQIAQALAFAQDPKHRHQQEVPGRDANPAPHPGVRDSLEVAD